MPECLTPDERLDPETERRTWDFDDALSQILKLRGITQYTIPFKDRPQVSILHEGLDSTLRRDVIDEH